MCAQEVDWVSFLPAKPSRRRNLTGGCLLRRPSISAFKLLGLGRFPPACALWPCIRRRVATGQQLFSHVYRRNFNRSLKTAMAKLETPEASLCTPMRLGATLLRNLRKLGPLVGSHPIWPFGDQLHSGDTSTCLAT